MGKASVLDSINKSVTASCPSGKQVVGTGARTSGLGSVVLRAIVPGTASVMASAVEGKAGTSASWTVAAPAICADPLPGREVVSAVSPLNSQTKVIGAACPVGKLALGGGVFTSSMSGEVILVGMAPKPTLTGVFATALEDDTGTTANWSVTAYAICATP